MRLIDADKLIKHLNDYALTEAPDDRERAGERRVSEAVYSAIQNCLEAVEEQPTAGWIPVTERLPEERNSIFAKFKGTADWWKPAMFEKTSPYVIATVRYKDGTVLTEQAHTEDGKWKVGTSVFPKEVIAWMPLPEPYREEQGNG